MKEVNFTEKELLATKSSLDRYARKLAQPQNADDLVQKVMLRAIEKQHLFKVGSDLKAWMMTMMYNKFIADLRGDQRRFSISLPVLPGDTVHLADLSSQSDLNVIISDVTAALKKIPKKQFDVLRYIAFQGMSYQECADTLNIPIGTVRSRLTRARESLNKHLS